ncbi:MAG TPA: tetratricopeptide repeat protein [Leptospiraceae bacterium]|jgi:tetratricopeptide (TPR) repeat protein|nr:tetratricopeptide repeat protein [Leptospirales bacterium]HMU83310.1 tetratricopeptide repeat protein [Leptospiraceae bacterium]HMX55857.1 tetratricopeptide repeat protein [Leptospiraceae bacterium]HMY43940.1 tetratricopeptide repeat protein [Leptospiraceae bacterium]HNE24281.1 tetratricopeptide repeat protein [Leptospiraceae bacterium]
MKKFILLTLVFTVAPVSAQDFYRQGKIAYGQKNYERARQLFEQAMQANPSNGNPCFYLGYMLDNQNRRDLAVQQYRRGVDLQMDADLREKSFWKIVLYYKYVQDWENLAIYSEKFLHYRDIPQVKEFLEEAKERRDPAEGKLRELTASAEKKRAAGDNKGAAADYRSILAIKWDEHSAWNLAALLMQMKEYSEALTMYNRLIDQKPGWEYFYKRGACHYSLRNYDASLQDFNKARTLNKKPDAGFKHFTALGEGLTLIELARYEEAREKLKQSLALKKSATAAAALSRLEWIHGNRSESERYAALASENEREKNHLTALMLFQSEKKPEERKNGAAAFSKWLASLSDEKYLHRTWTADLFILGRQGCIQANQPLCIPALEKIPEADRFHLGNLVTSAYPTEKRNAADVQRDFDFYYGKGLLDEGKVDAGLSALSRVSDTPVGAYYMAVGFAKKSQEKNAMDYLQRAAEKKPEYWDYAGKNEHFKALAARSSDFAYFLEHKGKPRPVEPAVIPGNEVKNEKAKDTSP